MERAERWQALTNRTVSSALGSFGPPTFEASFPPSWPFPFPLRPRPWLTCGKLYVLIFSLRSAPFTCPRRTDRRASISACNLRSIKRALRTRYAFVRFCRRERDRERDRSGGGDARMCTIQERITTEVSIYTVRPSRSAFAELSWASVRTRLKTRH